MPLNSIADYSRSTEGRDTVAIAIVTRRNAGQACTCELRDEIRQRSVGVVLHSDSVYALQAIEGMRTDRGIFGTFDVEFQQVYFGAMQEFVERHDGDQRAAGSGTSELAFRAQVDAGAAGFSSEGSLMNQAAVGESVVIQDTSEAFARIRRRLDRDYFRVWGMKERIERECADVRSGINDDGVCWTNFVSAGEEDAPERTDIRQGGEAKGAGTQLYLKRELNRQSQVSSGQAGPMRRNGRASQDLRSTPEPADSFENSHRTRR